MSDKTDIFGNPIEHLPTIITGPGASGLLEEALSGVPSFPGIEVEPQFRSAPSFATASESRRIFREIEAIQKIGINAKPDSMNMDQFRYVRGEQRWVDKTGLTGAITVGLPTAGFAFGAAAGLGASVATTGPGALVTGGPAALAGGAVGGTLGAGAAAPLNDALRDLEDFLTYGVTNKQNVSTRQQAIDAFQLTVDSMGFEAVLQSAFQGVLRVGSAALRGLGMATGLTGESVARFIEDSLESGLSIGPVDLNKPLFNMAAKVGLVIPVIGGPVRMAREVKGVQVSESLVRILDDMSPPLDRIVLSGKIARTALGRLGARTKHTRALYADVFDTIEKAEKAGLPPSIPSKLLKQVAVRNLVQKGALPKSTAGEAVGFPIAGDAAFEQALGKFAILPEFISGAEARTLLQNINQSAARRSGVVLKEGEFAIISEMGAALRESLEQAIWPDFITILGGRTIPIPAGAGGLAKLIGTANKSHRQMKVLTRSAAANPFRKVKKNLLDPGFDKPTSLELDELADVYLSSPGITRSVDFIENLDKLIGVPNRKALGRLVLAKAANPQSGLALVERNVGAPLGERMLPTIFRPSKGQFMKGETEVAVFSASGMRDALGLGGAIDVIKSESARQNRLALSRLLKGTDLTVPRLDAWLRTVERIQASPSGDPSTFLTRRVTLGGGIKSPFPNLGAQTLGVGGDLLIGPVSLGFFTWGFRAFARLVSTPKGLEVLRGGLNPALTRRQAQLLVARATKMLTDLNVEVDFEGAWDDVQ